MISPNTIKSHLGETISDVKNSGIIGLRNPYVTEKIPKKSPIISMVLILIINGNGKSFGFPEGRIRPQFKTPFGTPRMLPWTFGYRFSSVWSNSIAAPSPASR